MFAGYENNTIKRNLQIHFYCGCVIVGPTIISYNIDGVLLGHANCVYNFWDEAFLHGIVFKILKILLKFKCLLTLHSFCMYSALLSTCAWHLFEIRNIILRMNCTYLKRSECNAGRSSRCHPTNRGLPSVHLLLLLLLL